MLTVVSPGIVSRWPVVVTLPVATSDRDADNHLTDDAIERLFARARATYFEHCATVDPATISVERTTVQRGLCAASGETVTVSVGVVEVFPRTFTMLARVRPVGPADSDSDGLAATASCSLAPAGGVPDAMRDEFIAHAHAATHIH